MPEPTSDERSALIDYVRTVLGRTDERDEEVVDAVLAAGFRPPPVTAPSGNPAQEVLRVLLRHGITEDTGGTVALVEDLAALAARSSQPAVETTTEQHHADVRAAVIEAYRPDGQAIWWHQWDTKPQKRAGMEASVLAVWSGTSVAEQEADRGGAQAATGRGVFGPRTVQAALDAARSSHPALKATWITVTDEMVEAGVLATYNVRRANYGLEPLTATNLVEEGMDSATRSEVRAALTAALGVSRG